MGTEPGDNGIPQRVPVRCTVHPRCHNLKTQVHPRKSRVGGNAEPWFSRPPVVSRGPLSLRPPVRYSPQRQLPAGNPPADLHVP